MSVAGVIAASHDGLFPYFDGNWSRDSVDESGTSTPGISVKRTVVIEKVGARLCEMYKSSVSWLTSLIGLLSVLEGPEHAHCDAKECASSLLTLGGIDTTSRPVSGNLSSLAWCGES